ncbi:uncharacterized protein LOC143371687 [Andrena cerasifolii]|uniref:uncharacterized protein LOC143371687 n=1 Tax=Andrena cerasifolii TaxID=2819439 RepID=UPI004037ED8B
MRQRPSTFRLRHEPTTADIVAKYVLPVRDGTCRDVSSLVCQCKLVNGRDRMQQRMDYEKLIEHVMLCVQLYATNNPKYSDSVFKENACREIGKELNQPDDRGWSVLYDKHGETF